MSKVLTVLTEIKNKMNTVNKTGQENSKKIEETLSKTANILADELGKMSITQAKVLTSIVKTSESSHIEEKIRSWKILLNARKMDYWNHLRNVKIAETCARWHESDPPIIPKKFQPAPILGENACQRRTRLNLATDQMKCEIEIMNIKPQRLKQKFETLDSQMGQEIEEKFANKPEITNMAKSLWEDECYNEAARSEVEWRRKEKWYEQQELEYAEVNSTSRHPHSE